MCVCVQIRLAGASWAEQTARTASQVVRMKSSASPSLSTPGHGWVGITSTSLNPITWISSAINGVAVVVVCVSIHISAVLWHNIVLQLSTVT